MKLKEAAALLGANERYFTVVYEAFKFADEELVRNYIDFVVREPIEWIKGFPLKLKTRPSFAKPKAALIKLLKTKEIQDHLGAEYCSKAHDIVWDTFKKHGDDILNARVKISDSGSCTGDDEEVVEEKNELIMEEAHVGGDDIEEVADISSAGAPIPVINTPVNPWERKYRILKSVVLSMLNDYYREKIGIAEAIQILLANLDGDGESSL